MEWRHTQERSYQTLKGAITSRPILHLPDHTRQFVLRTDASEVGIGAILMQRFGDRLFPMTYISKKLSDRERRFSTIKRECLALVWSVRKLRMFLYGSEFVLQTDHRPLSFLNQSKYENNRVMRWTLFLQGYNFRIDAIKGKDNGADYLSRVT